MEKIKEIQERFNESIEGIQLLDKLEEKLNAPKAVILIVGGIVLSLVLFLVLGVGVMVNLVGFIYPAYASFKAIESPNKDLDTQWLIYWIVYGFLNVIETFLFIIQGSAMIYFALKLGFLIWLFAPQTMGAEVVYEKILRPYLLKHEERFDKAIDKIDKGLASTAVAASEIAENVKEVAEELEDLPVNPQVSDDEDEEDEDDDNNDDDEDEEEDEDNENEDSD